MINLGNYVDDPLGNYIYACVYTYFGKLGKLWLKA